MANEEQGGALASGGGPGNPAPAGAPAGGVAPSSASVWDFPLSWASGFNLIALAFFLWFAIGATCEIVTRNDDFVRVAAYQKSLIACRTSTLTGDKDCPKDPSSIEFWIEVASTQVRRYNALNSLGAPDRCHVPAVIGSQIGHFWEDCEITLANSADAATKQDLHKPQNRSLIRAILAPTWLSYSWFGLDERPKEPLYFLLVLASAAIGSLIAGLRISGFTTHRDLALGIGAGFAIYLLLRSGNFVFFTGSAATDILNPFTAATVGLLVGLFYENAFGLLAKAMPASLSATASAAVQTAAKAQADAVAAATKLVNDLQEAIKKTASGSAEQKALQDIAPAVLDAKTKTDSAAKAQTDAFGRR